MDTPFHPASLTSQGANGTGLSLERFHQLPLRNKVALAGAVAMLIALLFIGLGYGRQPEWRVLYANLNDRDGGAVMAGLAQLNIPHKFTEGGGALMVPAPMVHEARLKLASQGLPKGGTVGFELLENQKFGVTQFQERLNFQRGLEGELARSVMALGAVENARIHLALPQQTAFMREQQKPSASVLLTLYGGRTLDRSQIAGIIHLVASSVPDLQTRAVSVVDQNGTLLSQSGNDAPNGLDANQLQYVRQAEQNLSTRILSILEPIVGAGNVRAQVTADIDFTQTESTAELFTPNQGNAPSAVRSQQLSEAPGSGASGGFAGGAIGGVPGALTNQPPPTTASPINGGNQPLSAGAGSSMGGGGVKRDALTNYEVDKTVRVVRNATGVTRRLSAAVVVNHASVAAADGKSTLKALSAAQMEQINTLVREAMGFSKERGDSVNVVNAPFTVVNPPAPAALPLWQQPEMQDLARSLAPWLALPLVALIIILGLVRPAIKTARLSPAEPLMLQATVSDTLTLPAPDASGALGDSHGDGVQLITPAQSPQQLARTAQLENIRQLAKQNPGTVANVVRNWANQPATPELLNHG